jgi:hypothetical protein
MCPIIVECSIICLLCHHLAFFGRFTFHPIGCMGVPMRTIPTRDQVANVVWFFAYAETVVNLGFKVRVAQFYKKQ